MNSLVSIIVAVSENWGIGRDNDLLYRLPADLRHFKALTTGHTIIMGRRTFESLPKGALPNRRNIVLSSQPSAHFPGAEHYTTLQAAFKASQREEEIFIIGGGSVYGEALALCDRIYLTRVEHTHPEATVFFPPLNPDEWETLAKESYPADEKHAYPYQFLTLERKKPEASSPNP